MKTKNPHQNGRGSFRYVLATGVAGRVGVVVVLGCRSRKTHEAEDDHECDRHTDFDGHTDHEAGCDDGTHDERQNEIDEHKSSPEKRGKGRKDNRVTTIMGAPPRITRV